MGSNPIRAFCVDLSMYLAAERMKNGLNLNNSREIQSNDGGDKK